MIPRRGVTPLRVGAPSLEASSQAQIDDLVQRNRTLEHTVKKLSDQVALEVSRSKETATTVQGQWQHKQQEWREGCYLLHSCHRIIQLRNTVELESKRMSVLKELDAMRKEKLKRLQRDFRITMFQVKEAELEGRVLELEDQKESMIGQYEEKIRRSKVLSVDYAAQVKAKHDKFAAVEQEKEELEEKLGQLREEHAHRNASTEMLVSKLERTALQLDGAQTKNLDLERTNEELKRTNGEIQRQLVKWQNLETKGDLEVETLRKRRIELEVHVKELEARLDKNTQSGTKALEKEQRRAEKLKKDAVEWQEKATRNEAEAEEAQKQFEKAQKQVEKLKAKLEVSRARVRSSSPQKKGRPPHETSEDEVAHEIALEQESSSSRAKSPRDKPKPRSRQAKSGARGRRDADFDNELVYSGSSEVQAVVRIPAGQSKEKAVNGEVQTIEVDGPAKQRGKRKASSREEEETPDVETVPGPARGKGASRTASETRDIVTNSKSRGGAYRDSSAQPRQRHREGTLASDTEDAAPKKKKRKINIFPTNTNSTAFNFMPQVDNGLNIPTILSPVKETESIPNRSTSGSVIGSIGSMLKNSFVGSRR